MMRLTLISFLLVWTCGLLAQTPFIETYSRGLELIDEEKFREAADTLERACQLAQPKGQERSKALRGKGMALYRLAQSLNLKQDYEAAYGNYGESMKCFGRVGLDRDVLDCVRAMAVMNSRHFGFLDLALEQLDHAYGLAEKLKLPEVQLEVLDEKGWIFSRLHDEGSRTAVSLRMDSILSANPSPELRVKEYLRRGDNARDNGDAEVALSAYHSALKVNIKGTDEFFIYQRLRDLYSKLEDYANALKFSDKCVSFWLQLFEDDNPQRYLIYSNHYPIQLKAGDVAGVMASLDSIQKSVDAGGSFPERLRFLTDKGRVFSELKDFRRAVCCYRECDSLLSEAEMTPALVEVRRTMLPLYAGTLYQNNDLRESKETYLRYLGSVEEAYGRKSMEYAQALQYLAAIEGFLGELGTGAGHYIEAWETAGEIARQDLQMLPSNARGKYWQEINDLMWNMVPYAIAAGFQEDRFTSAAYEALMFSKGLLLSVEKSTGRVIQNYGDSGLTADFQEVADIRNEIERQRSLKNGAEVMRLYARMDSLDRNLSLRMRSLDITPTVPALSCSDITDRLKEGEAVLDFADFVKQDGSHVYAAFVLKKEFRAPRLIRVFEQSALDSLLVENRGRYADLYNEGNAERLSGILLKPLMPELAGIRTVYLIPSGILNQIALEAVPLPDGSCFGDRFDVVRLSSAREILSFDRNRVLSDAKSARLYGGLDYDVDATEMAAAASESPIPDLLATRGETVGLSGQKGFDKLKMSMGEVTEIAEILTQSDIKVTALTGSHGTEESFVGMSGDSPDLLLLSTHGFYYSPENVPSWSSLNGYENPMCLTGLVMSGGNAEYLKREIPEGVLGGLLTSSDIAGLDLGGTRLVVLSACETGLGETTNEGVYGLQRAFKKAGAGTLVLSLWPVSDLATKEFMTDFHRELAAKGWDKRKAFENARRHIRERYDNPYYWAAFIMID